jgi:hypothetical protein
MSYTSSPRNPFSYQQSPGVSSSSTTTKTPLSSSSSSGLSTSVPPHFTYPTSTQPVLQYSTIVSQNTPTSTTNSNSISKQQSVLSPKPNPMSRQTSVNNNDSTVNTTSNQSTSTITTNSTANSSHPPPLLANNDRSGRIFY